MLTIDKGEADVSVRGRVLGLKRAVSSGEIFKRHPEFMKVLGYAANLVLGYAMAAAKLFGGCGPFGIGIVAQAGAGPGGVMCLLGASLGYLMVGGFDYGIKYVATCVLIFTAAFVFQGARFYNSSWFMPAVAAAITAVTGFLNSFDNARGVPPVVLMITEVTLAGSCAYFFKQALTREEIATETAELRHGVSVLILLACALMALSEIMIMDVISIGRLVAVLLVMTAAYKGGILAGSAAGAALGLAMDIAYGGAPYFTMAYAFSGLLAGVFSRHGRLIFLISYIMADAVAVLWTWSYGVRIEVLYEVFAASVIFIMLPSSLLSTIGGLLEQSRSGSGETGIRLYIARRVRRISEAFRELYETVHTTLERAGNDNDIATVFDRAADAVCVRCKNREDCWQVNYMDTLSVMNSATPAMMRRGRLVKEDLAEHFVEKCSSIYSFIAAVNGELRGLMYRRQFRSRLAENRTAAYSQYSDLAVIMESISDDLSKSPGPDPLAERRLLRFLRNMDIEADVSVFRDRSGRLRITIESGRLRNLLKEPDYLDKLSSVVGVRLCRPGVDDLANAKRLSLVEAEPLAVSVGIAAVKKKGEPVSGDRGTYFKTDQGVLCVILSDGMGSGHEAARESIATVRILENFLRSGVSPDTAMKILNSVLLLKNGEEWGYATVDLMCIDLFTGETSFYKYGAAPSYIKNGKLVRRVRGESLAAGLCAGECAAPDIIRMRLKPGNIALIASDGVITAENDKWLKALLSGWEGTDTKALAKEALQTAIREFGCEDDMTVLVVRVDARS